MIYRETVMKQQNIQIITTDKYKEVAIELRFLTLSVRRRNAIRTLVAYMMSDRIEKYPSKLSMSEALDRLYGATYYAGSLTLGQVHVFRLRMKALHPDFSEAEQLKNQMSFLREALYHPYLTEDTLREAKKVLLDNLKRQEENPGYYASKRIYEIFGENTPLALSATGSREDVESITLNDCIKEHQRMLKEDAAYIMALGNVEKKTMEEELAEMFPLGTEMPDLPLSYRFGEVAPQSVSEVRNLPQASVRLIYPNDTIYSDEDYWAMKLGCIMLGQLPTSLLFEEVREKRSLCYSITSHNSRYFSILQVSTAMEEANIPEALKLIEEQIRRIQKGEVSEELLSMAKIMLINDYEESRDEINGQMNQAFEDYLCQSDSSLLYERINAVSLPEVSAAFNKLKEPTVFLLKGGMKHGTDAE